MENQQKRDSDKLKEIKIKLTKIRVLRKKAVERAKRIDQVELEKLKEEFELAFEALAIKYEYMIRKKLNSGLKSYIEKEKTSVDKFLNDYKEDISKTFKRQFEWPESDFGLEKLVKFKEEKHLLNTLGLRQTHLFTYMLEATNTFCRKKRNYYDVERLKRNAKPEDKYEHNPGAACRELFHGKGCSDVWLSSKAIKIIETASISEEVLIKVRNYLIDNNVKNEIAQTFVDRLDGMKFTEMARFYRGDDNQTSPKESTFRNRFNRLKKSSLVNCEDFRQLLLADYENYTSP